MVELKLAPFVYIPIPLVTNLFFNRQMFLRHCILNCDFPVSQINGLVSLSLHGFALHRASSRAQPLFHTHITINDKRKKIIGHPLIKVAKINYIQCNSFLRIKTSCMRIKKRFDGRIPLLESQRRPVPSLYCGQTFPAPPLRRPRKKAGSSHIICKKRQNLSIHL